MPKTVSGRSPLLTVPEGHPDRHGKQKGHVMHFEDMLDRYLEPLLRGSRFECRELITKVLRLGVDPKVIYHRILWPAMERVDLLFREDRIGTAIEHMATRINRSLADQVQSRLPRSGTNGKRVLIMCADNEPEELGAQMTADLFESDGWEVYFVGGGIPHDEILSMAGQIRPDLLLIFGTQPSGVPGTRSLIETIREMGVNPTMNTMVSGGVFNRADGLWEEINCDLFAPTAKDALALANSAVPRKAEVRIPGAPKKKRRRRRRPPLLEQAAGLA
ncbi:MAG: cobalamin-dependent protein [Phycisphaerae bacterium]|nr:cobalamin-dependent protein [Phycisphaerae bacterium]